MYKVVNHLEYAEGPERPKRRSSSHAEVGSGERRGFAGLCRLIWPKSDMRARWMSG